MILRCHTGTPTLSIPREILLLEFARGCKFKCKFCSFRSRCQGWLLSHAFQSVYDEMLENYDKWGTEHYIVLDETFNDSSEKIEKFASVIEKLHSHRRWLRTFVQTW